LQSDPRTDVGVAVKRVWVARKDRAGRAESVSIEGNRTVSVRGWDFKIIVGRRLGWNVLKSSWFDVAPSGGAFIFHGHGFGHGLGLCQEGAHQMARQGSSYGQILAHYFPTTKVSMPTAVAGTRSIGEPGIAATRVVKTAESPAVLASTARHIDDVLATNGPDSLGAPAIGPWGEQSIPVSYRFPARSSGRCLLSPTEPHAELVAARWITDSPGRYLSSEHFRVSYSDPTEEHDVESVLDTLESAHRDLTIRLSAAGVDFESPGPIDIVINSTTQDFTAATGQPWWAAAATRGRRIQLQPIPLLRRRRILETTLRHECAHLAIDSVSQRTSPRWLAEGLAIYFAGEGPQLRKYSPAQPISVDELEKRLAAPHDSKEMRELYAAAFVRVYDMVRSRGESSVWALVAKPTPPGA